MDCFLERRTRRLYEKRGFLGFLVLGTATILHEKNYTVRKFLLVKWYLCVIFSMEPWEVLWGIADWTCRRVSKD